MVWDSFIVLHIGHLLQGSESNGFSQFKALARILAVVVLPTPRGPVKIYA
jgi:hypothetical protein